MTRDWEQVFRVWSKPASETEQNKCNNAEKMIKEAITSDPVLSDMNIEIFAQGSYKNNTNVRQNSDVDICVRLFNTFFYDLPKGTNMDYFGITPSTYNYASFKDNVETALVAKFGRQGVKRGNKAFDIHANSYRVDADVVPCFEHRRYSINPDGTYSYLSGVEFRPDSGGQVINWPLQYYENGVNKNNNTNYRYKYITRVIKRLRYEMEDKGFSSAKVIPSFLIECLLWNVPDNYFGNENYSDDVRTTLAFLFNNTINLKDCIEWGEVSELKYLFRESQPWTLKHAHDFLDAAWDYIGFD